MKKKLYLLFFSLISISIAKGQVSSGMPGILQVAVHFFTFYDSPDDEYVYIKFEKKATGWYVAKISFNDGNPVEPARLFWDKAKNSYLSLGFKQEADTGDAAMHDRLDHYKEITGLDEFETYSYDRNLFYGYNQWDKDVMNAVELMDHPTDTLLESLARAYSNYAVTFFYNQFGNWSDQDNPDRTKLKDNEPVPVARVQKYISYEQKCIATYQKLIELNPTYECIVGNVRTKLINEKMFAFTTLRFCGYEKEGKSFLEGISFPDSLLEAGKAMLNEVMPNSIFFTSGDNVTYPIWYLQSTGFRKDVIAIDYNLIGLRRVAYWYDKEYKHILFSADSAIYMNRWFDYALAQVEDSAKTMRLDEFIKGLYKSVDLTKLSNGDTTRYYSLNRPFFKYFVQNTYLDVDALKAKTIYDGPLSCNKIERCFTKSYIWMNEMLELDILQQNFLKRRIYYSFIPDDPCYSKCIKTRTYTYELTPVQEQ